MYKLLIIEDDDIIREGLQSAIPWELYNVRLVESARDGEEGFNNCKKYCPDIAFVDINIPIMNGLELSKKMLEINANMKVIIITGLNDFELLHEALRIGVFDYLLKPFQRYELINVLVRAKELLDKIIDRNALAEQMKNTFNTYLPQIKEIFFNKLISSDIHDETSIIAACKELNIEFQDFIRCSVVCIEQGHRREDMPSDIMQSIIDKIFGSTYKYCYFYNANNNLILLTSSDSREDTIDEYLNMFRENLVFYMKADILIYYGRVFESISDIKPYYEETIQLEKYRYMHTEKVFGYGDVEMLGLSSNQEDIHDITSIIECVRIHDIERLPVIVKKCLTDAGGYPDLLQKAKRDGICILSESLRLCLELNMDVGFIIDKDSNLFIEWSNRNDLDDMISWLCDKLIGLSHKLNAGRRNKSEKVLNRIIEYINSGYSDFNLNVSMISSRFNISTGYLSTLFKQYTGRNLSDYISMVRIDIAKKLLNDPTLKVSDIAGRSGFGNHNYFSTIFKSYTGLTPTEYRERCSDV